MNRFHVPFLCFLPHPHFHVAATHSDSVQGHPSLFPRRPTTQCSVAVRDCTLAYLLPIIQALGVDRQGELVKKNRLQAGTRCIILCPTRELASQTFTVVEKLCKISFIWLVPGCLFGEERRKSEKARIRKGLAIIVATPGRLLDHLTRTESLLMALKGKLEWLVLDEADRLLDMGLGEQDTQIIQRIRANQPGSGRNEIAWQCHARRAATGLEKIYETI
jgi:superfamily II DNA/RNA helicase